MPDKENGRITIGVKCEYFPFDIKMAERDKECETQKEYKRLNAKRARDALIQSHVRHLKAKLVKATVV